MVRAAGAGARLEPQRPGPSNRKPLVRAPRPRPDQFLAHAAGAAIRTGPADRQGSLCVRFSVAESAGERTRPGTGAHRPLALAHHGARQGLRLRRQPIPAGDRRRGLLHRPAVLSPASALLRGVRTQDGGIQARIRRQDELLSLRHRRLPCAMPTTARPSASSCAKAATGSWSSTRCATRSSRWAWPNTNSPPPCPRACANSCRPQRT